MQEKKIIANTLDHEVKENILKTLDQMYIQACENEIERHPKRQRRIVAEMKRLLKNNPAFQEWRAQWATVRR